MKKFIPQVVLPFLAKRGFTLQKETEKEKVVDLIRELHPLQTQFDLIRLGPNKDGGYLVPNCLEGIETCFSPGVAQVSEFEIECLNRGMKLFMADKSVEKPNWDIPESQYSFQKKFIGCTNNQDFMTMDSWFNSTRLADDTELLLQMDIEGGEYSSIMSMSDELMSRFRVMVFEFHRLQHLWNRAFFEIAETVFKKILQTHICVHLHPNNYKDSKFSVHSRQGIDIPKVMEMTFIRKDIAQTNGYQSQFPHALDFDNTSSQHLPLPKDWYRN